MAGHPDEIRPGPLVLDEGRVWACCEAWRDAPGVAPDLLDLARWSVELVGRHADRFGGIVVAAPLAGREAAALLAAGKPLAGADDLRIDQAAVVAVADAVRERLGADAVPGHTWQNCRRRLAADPTAAAALVLLNLADQPDDLDETAARCGLPPGILRFLARQTGLVALSAAAARLAPLVDDRAWRRGSCPVCGSSPALAGLVGEAGARLLVCGLCRFVWSHPRLRCPFCDNRDSETLQVLSPDDRAPHHLDACRRCSCYVKTVDYRHVDAARPVVLPIDDAATYYLDLMAQKEGLRRA
jgi:formate dehydrogenase accessory protein FdhE